MQKVIILPESEKIKIQGYFNPLIETFKQECISNTPDKRFSYLIDIYTRWYRNHFYICEKYKSEFEDRIADEFETKIVRLTFVGNNAFNFSYFRHTGQWHLVEQQLTIEACMELIQTNPNFQPISY